jgi:hypothetical protein
VFVLSNGIKVVYTVEVHGDERVPHVSMSKKGHQLKCKQVRQVLEHLGFSTSARVSQNPASGVWHAWNKDWAGPGEVDFEQMTALNQDVDEAMQIAAHSCPVGQQFWRDSLALKDTDEWEEPSSQDRQRWQRQVMTAHQSAPQVPVLNWEGPPADQREVYVRELLEAQVAHVACCLVCEMAHQAAESGATA